MKCLHCGKEIADTNKFCPYCGTKVEKPIRNAPDDTPTLHIVEKKPGGVPDIPVIPGQKKNSELMRYILYFVAAIAFMAFMGFAGNFIYNQLEAGKQETTVEHGTSDYGEEPEPQEEPKPAPIESVDGYDPGDYRANYQMTVRKGPSKSSKDSGDTIYKDDEVYIAQVQKNSSDESIWGELYSSDSGMWVCLKDNQYNYLVKE